MKIISAEFPPTSTNMTSTIMDPKFKFSNDGSGLAFQEILKEGEDKTFSNLHNFIVKTIGSRKSLGGAYAPTRVDRVTFFNSKPPTFDSHIGNINHNHQSLDDEGGPIAAKLFIIESIDVAHIRWLLETLASDASDRHSILSFINDYFYDEPTSNFDNVQVQIPATPSSQARQQHQTFDFIKLREFDRPFELSYKDIQAASRAAGMWRSNKSYGSLNPIPRVETGGRKTVFPPIAVARTRVSAWFGCDAGKMTWRTGKQNLMSSWLFSFYSSQGKLMLYVTRIGVILMDREPHFEGLPAQLKASYHVVAGHTYHGYTSIQSLLLDCMKRNCNMAGASGVPVPLAVLQDLYSIVGYEGMRVNAYTTRDLNSIDWALEGGGNTANQVTYRSEMRKLLAMRRRLNWSRSQVEAVLASCRDKAKLGWGKMPHGSEREVVVVEDIAGDLARDFKQIEVTMATTSDRIEQSIHHIMGDATITEAERTNAQSNILLAIAAVGTFFMPISTAAAIFSMSGDWAVGEVGFRKFWAVCIPMSIFLTGLLVAIMRWRVIREWMSMSMRRRVLV